MPRKKPNRLDIVAVAARRCRCVSGLRTSRDADGSGRAENGETGDVGDNSRMWETTHGNLSEALVAALRQGSDEIHDAARLGRAWQHAIDSNAGAGDRPG